ncbi:MAG: hypothetical protein WBF90_27115 [Rivularia sp. (in: cyanobacteria)]|jgi:hypothetical protein
MINPIIVQSNTLCLLQLSCNVDNQLLLLQFSEEQSDTAIEQSAVVDSPETKMYRDWCLDGKFPPRYI